MKKKGPNTKQKKVFFKTYQNLSEIENSIGFIKTFRTSMFEVSILGKFNEEYTNNPTALEKEIKSKESYCKKILGNSIEYDSFNNTEIGAFFVAGSLVGTFRQEVGGKPLANISSGVYGIFRGIVANESKALKYFKMLDIGYYLLIIRGLENEIEPIVNILESQE